MKIWLRRIVALGLLSLGIALTFLPYNETRSGAIQQEIVYLQKEELLNPDEISTHYPGAEITDITGPELNQDDYPDLWRALINLDTDWVNDSAGPEEWNRFQNSVLQGKKFFRLVVFRENLITCSIGKDQEVEEDASEVALFTYLGRFNLNIRVLSESDLNKYPAIASAVRSFEAGDALEDDSVTIPKDEWDKMVDRYLEPLVDSQTFEFNGNFYGPQFGWDYTVKEGTVSGLRTILKVIGVVLSLIGFRLISRLYFRKRGIMVNPRKVAILYDVITLLFAIPSAYMVANMVLSKTLFITPITDEDFIVFQGIFFFCVGIPFVTLYTSRFTSQSVVIDSEGIYVDSLIEKDSMTWESLTSIGLSDEYVLVSRVGISLPKQVQKSLMVEGKEGQKMIINEPQLKSVKKKIVLRFEQYAPDHLKDRFRQVLAKW